MDLESSDNLIALAEIVATYYKALLNEDIEQDIATALSLGFQDSWIRVLADKDDDEDES